MTTADIRDFPLNHRTIAAVIEGEMPDVQQRANVAIAIIEALPVELREAVLVRLINNP